MGNESVIAILLGKCALHKRTGNFEITYKSANGLSPLRGQSNLPSNSGIVASPKLISYKGRVA